MFSLGKLSRYLPSTGKLLQPTNTFGITLSSYTNNYILSLVHTSHQPFGRAPIPNKQKNKEKVSAPAYSDEKVGKTSKAEEEAENKKRKAEEHRLKMERATRKVIPVRTQTPVFEAKFTPARIEYELEKAKKKGYLFLDEEYHPEIEKKSAETPKKLAETPKKAYREINDVVRKETPSLKRKVVEECFNTESIVNQEFYKELKPNTAHEDSKRSGVIAFKVGMTTLWDRWGIKYALTVLQVDRC